MARLLDVAARSEPARVPERAAAPAAPPNPATDTDDDSSIPFIEVGAPVKRDAGAFDRNAAPAIIPMPRPEPRTSQAASSPKLLRVTFRPLPFVAPPSQPAGQRLPYELVAYHQPEHEISGQYRAVLSEIEQQLGIAPGKTILFTAANAGAGTTSIVLNLALTCSRREHDRIIVVDANLAAPTIADRLGVRSAPGVRDVLAASLPLSWTIQECGVPRLSVLAAGDRRASPTLEAWPALVDQLRKRYDWVLIDAPAWGSPGELSALAGPCAATYLVLRPADFEAPHLDDMLVAAGQGGGRVRGYVLAQP